MVGDDADTLLIIECLPALETRNYVEKVMAAYWTYRRLFGEDSKTLDALARGAAFIDARLDG
jgi:soluble lytic murein transglycosylase-like protein